MLRNEPNRIVERLITENTKNTEILNHIDELESILKSSNETIEQMAQDLSERAGG